MFEFCGWLGLPTGGERTGEILEGMARSPRVADTAAKVTVWSSGRVALATVGGAGPRGDASSPARIAWVGRPRIAGRAPGSDDALAAALVDGYRVEGPAFLSRLHGDYALAICDPDRSKGIVAVDRIGGRHTIAYRVVEDGLLFGTTADAVVAHPAGRSDLDRQAIFDYVYFHVVPAPRTMWRDVARLLPGSYADFDGRSVTVGRHWVPEFREVDRPVPELVEEFRAILEDATRRAAEGTGVGCFLSGGTDSSTVAGMFGVVTGRPASTYSIGFGTAGFDEMEYARAVVGHFGTRHRERRVTPEDVVDAIPVITSAHAEPFGNASAAPTWVCARTAREDAIDLMLAGDGGDELFGGNTRYAKQKVFEAYHAVPAALRSKVVEPILFSVPGGGRIPPIRKARSYVRQANVPMPRRLEAYNYTERFGTGAMFEPSFLDGIDVGEPGDWLERTYREAAADGLVNRMLAMDLKYTLADNDLPKVSRMCAAAGVKVAYPLLDDAVVDFSLRLPAGLKVRGLTLRWFFKHALKDFLPRVVLDKKKHGFGLPFGIWLRDHAGLQEICRDALSGLEGRGLVRPDFLRDLRRLHETEHATYYGVLIWVFVQLELWLRSRGPSAR